MTLRLLRRAVYRCLQRAIVLERVTVMVARTSAVTEATGNRVVKQLDKRSLVTFLELGDAPYCEALVARLDDPRLHCFAVVEAGRLRSFAWFYRGSAEAEMNYGRSKATASAIELDEDTAFVFHAHTAADSRGKRMMAAVLSHAARELAASDRVDWLVATTECVNDAARHAFRRVGFQEVGRYTRFGVGRCVFGAYPTPVPPIRSFG